MKAHVTNNSQGHVGSSVRFIWDQVLDAGEMKDLAPAKRHTLILALIRQMRINARDDIAEMLIRRGAAHKSAREELLLIQARQRKHLRLYSKMNTKRPNGSPMKLICRSHLNVDVR